MSTEAETKPAKTWLNRTVLGIGLASLLSDWSHEIATTVLPAFLATMRVLWAAVSPNAGFAAAGGLALCAAGLLSVLRFPKPAGANGASAKATLR